MTRPYFMQAQPPALWKNFRYSEFKCPCGCGNLTSELLLDELQILRDIVKFPLVITSGYRCEAYNNKIAGAPKSMHVKGLAADISWNSMSGRDRHILLQEASKLFGGIGLHPLFLHVDLRKIENVWFYPV